MKKLKMADQLPLDVIMQILLRLPPKLVIRFRLACKSWLSLISSTRFMLLYPRTNNFSRTLVRRVSWREKKETYSVHFNDQHFSLDTRVSIQLPLNLQHGGNTHLIPIGCCNGVICLSDNRRESDVTILWNPSIRKKLTLDPPILCHNYSQNWYTTCGFGYDKMTDDYKVVRFTYIGVSSMTIHVQVYSVKTSIWRVVEFPHDLRCGRLFTHYEHVPVFFSGSAHWIFRSTPKIHNSILTFDMSTECFEEIQLPENLARVNPLRLRLVVVEECLGVIYSMKEYEIPSITYQIWAMKEYKKPMTWTMMHQLYYLDKDEETTLGATNDGRLIIASKQGDLKIYNQETCYDVIGSGTQAIIDSPWIFVARYEEGLGLLDVGDDVNVRVQELDHE